MRYTWMIAPLRRSALAMVAVLLVACGSDRPTRPTSAVLYRLRAVNGESLPFRILNGYGAVLITGGELLLRPDGTFATGLHGDPFGMTTGTYDLSDSRLTFRIASADPSDAILLLGVTGGDTATIDVPSNPFRTPSALHYLFERARQGQGTLAEGYYALTAVRGVSPSSSIGRGFVALDTTSAGVRTVWRILFDTLQFTDGVFYRRHRAGVDSSFAPGSLPVVGSYDDDGWGSYAGDRTTLILEPYTAAPRPDTLLVSSGSLVRRWRTGVEWSFGRLE